MAIAGDVRGFEAVPFTIPDIQLASTSGVAASLLVADTSKYSVGDVVYVEVTLGVYARSIIGLIDSSTIFTLVDGTGRLVNGNVLVETKQTHKQAKPTWTDIIGSPANIAATFPEGVEGQWIPEIPDGTSKTFPLNRKATAATSTVPRVLTQNNGVSWVTDNISMSSTTNKMTSGAPATTVWLSSYETQAHFTEDSNNSEVLDLGGVYVQHDYSVNKGVILSSTLVGKVTIANQSGSRGDSPSITTLGQSETYDALASGLTHTTVNLSPSYNSHAVKALDYLSSENGVAKLSYAYKEMAYDSGADSPNEHTFVNQSSTFSYVAGNVYKLIHSNFVKLRDSVFVAEVSFTDTASNVDRYSLFQDGSLKSSNGSTKLVLHDGNGWGDNNQFEIANNQTTQTDDNGNTIKYGTASFDTQYFVVEE
jgi:hypothetical protein